MSQPEQTTVEYLRQRDRMRARILFVVIAIGLVVSGIVATVKVQAANERRQECEVMEYVDGRDC